MSRRESNPSLRLVVLLIAIVAVACGSNGSPTAPEATETYPYRSYAGMRSLSVIEGGESCLGQLLATSGPTPIQFEIAHPPDPDFVGDLRIGTGPPPRESCSVVGQIASPRIRWLEHHCYPNCWWESFECDGRTWSFCRRAAATEFTGTISDRQVAGTQIVRFQATNGSTSYEIEVEFDYRLEANR